MASKLSINGCKNGGKQLYSEDKYVVASLNSRFIQMNFLN